MSALLIYGANGYTGELAAREAARRGLRPLLAGRSPAVATLAGELGLEARVVGLEDAAALARALDGVSAVLHCAGPFSRTARPMVEACLARRAHYLDVTGEPAVFEAVAGYDPRAREAGVMLLPGVGFDVVPSDCLANHLARRLPGAVELALGFEGLGAISRGTARTVAENLPRGSLVRERGRLVPLATGSRVRTIDFGRGPRTAMAISWGDVVTAYRSTGIPNVTVYSPVPPWLPPLLRASGPLTPLLAWPRLQAAVARSLSRGRAGPSAEERARGASYLWGEVTDAAGKRAVSRLVTPEGYTHTVDAALEIAGRVLAGQAPPGWQTPATAYGPDLVLALPGVERADEPQA